MHVTEPSGETCYYKHPRTRMGGTITKDVTTGYGPEMYLLPKAKAGAYKIQAKYFAKDDNRASTRTRVFMTLYRYWGTEKEEQIHKAITLETGKEMHDLATFKMSWWK